MKHAAWLATLWLAGCCCLRPHPAPPGQPAEVEPPAAAVAEPAIVAPAPAVMTTPEAAVAAVPAPADPPVAQPPPAQPARPPQTEHGQWTIVVVSERTEHDTRAWVQRLGDAGFRVEIQPVKIGDTLWYRVLLPGFRARGEALAALPLANTAAGVKDSFIWRRRPEGNAGN